MTKKFFISENFKFVNIRKNYVLTNISGLKLQYQGHTIKSSRQFRSYTDTFTADENTTLVDNNNSLIEGETKLKQ